MNINPGISEYLEKLAEEYYRLGKLPELSEQQGERLIQILEIAEANKEFSEILSEIDLKLANELNLLDEEHLTYYEQQTQKLQQKLKRE
ncbi:hypothetical protein [Gloeothece verrucosa]|uniref:Uncharacterized protein n=1 Tax=Gloeothece verrucosa (strain PCC 7822) TaxID=497965 RepID=E0UNI9_GLOV7|nr:hypothetical protein [Gloeothece verrucosa]ADN18519.1 hypothetical protein Cyan7822_6873 [Gloeothece verrucosa PCC 7822]ADN18578.1 hypothetical protein Cyan7822_6940 [Gloeothece verrucosa PCC 7822]